MPSFIHHFIQKVFPVYLLCSRPQAGSWGIQRWIRHSPGLSIAFNLKKCFKKHFRSCVMGLKDLNKMLSEPRGQRHKVGHKSWCGVSEAARELIQIHFSYNTKSYPSYPTNQPTLPFFFYLPVHQPLLSCLNYCKRLTIGIPALLYILSSTEARMIFRNTNWILPHPFKPFINFPLESEPKLPKAYQAF